MTRCDYHALILNNNTQPCFNFEFTILRILFLIHNLLCSFLKPFEIHACSKWYKNVKVIQITKMSDDSSLPSATRDSDAVDDDSSRSQGRHLGRNQTESQRIASLEAKLERQNKDIRNLKEVVESLQNAFVERFDKAESELKKKDEEIKAVKKELADKDSKIAELKKKMESADEIAAQRIEDVAKQKQDGDGRSIWAASWENRIFA